MVDVIVTEEDGPVNIFHARSDRARAWVAEHGADWWVEDPPTDARIVVESRTDAVRHVADRLAADGLTIEWWS
jgi:hypothetical protein